MFDVFTWSFPAGRLFGIRIRVHYLFPLVVLPFVLRVSLRETAPAGTWIDAFTVALIFSLVVLMHELGHALMARYVGGEPEDVMLWPLGGLARAGFLPHHPRAQLLFSAGGPLVDFCVFLSSALILGFGFSESIRPALNPFTWYPFRDPNPAGLYKLFTWSGEEFRTSSTALMLVAWICWVSWFTFLFNTLLVGLPWDAGNIGRAILWPYVGYQQATLYMITSGFVVMALLFVVSIFLAEPLLLCLALYAFFMCWQEWLHLTHRGEESVFGYDFSQGYTSLEKDHPDAIAPRRKRPNFFQRWLQRRQARKLQKEQERQEADERRMDELLEKIQRSGKESLTEEETRFMKRVSERYRNRN